MPSFLVLARCEMGDVPVSIHKSQKEAERVMNRLTQETADKINGQFLRGCPSRMFFVNVVLMTGREPPEIVAERDMGQRR